MNRGANGPSAFLVFLDPANPIVVVLVVASGVIQPVWNIWTGSLLLSNGVLA